MILHNYVRISYSMLCYSLRGMRHTCRAERGKCTLEGRTLHASGHMILHNLEHIPLDTRRREYNEGKRQKAIYRLVTAPQGGTQKYTLAFAYDSPC